MDLNVLYFVIALLLFLSIVGSTLSARIGMPLLLGFLGVGMLAGEEGILKIPFEGFFLANFIGQGALAVILLDGGLRTSVKSFRIALRPSAVLASWGVLATVVLLGVFATWLLEVDWRLGFLMAAIVGSTDAGAVFSLLRNGGIRLNERVQATLEIESGANDPMAILLVTGFIALNLAPEATSAADFFVLLCKQLGIGVIAGFFFGRVLSWILPKIHLAEGMYALLIASGAMLGFALVNMAGGSGFLAIYMAGVIIGNRRTRATEHVLRVMDGMAWLAQATLFVVLGLLVTPSRVLHLWPYALALAAFLFLIARPLAVASGLFPFRFKWNEVSFISWVGLRGAVPVTLAIMPVMQEVQGADMLFNLTFGIVILSLLIQGTTLPITSRLFHVQVPTTGEPHDDHEIWVGDKASIHLLEFVVQKGSFAITRHPDEIAKRVAEEEVRFFALVRGGELMADSPNIALRGGDHVWFTVRGDHGQTLARIFNDTYVTRREKTEFFGEWVVSPQVLISDLALLDEVPMDDADRQKTIAELFAERLGETVVGDVLDVGGDWDLVVRDMNDHGAITAVGLKLDRKRGETPEGI
ncbi:MAG: potassium/proton antiporter [Cardiobacteriaceae bacterium]|nr:potassium/proton antiporter [Cardiobacteriaceae bacterium]